MQQTVHTSFQHKAGLMRMGDLTDRDVDKADSDGSEDVTEKVTTLCYCGVFRVPTLGTVDVQLYP